MWRMPLWRPYLRYLNSHVADIANGSSTRMAGSITAALYLERLVPAAQKWAHVDVYAWNYSDRPGRPAGREAQGLRAAYEMLKQRCASVGATPPTASGAVSSATLRRSEEHTSEPQQLMR